MSKSLNKKVLLVPGWNYPELNRGIIDFAREHSWQLNMLVALHWILPWGWQGDGVITQLGRSEEQNRFVESLTAPIVDMDLHRHDWNLPRVLQDNQLIAKLAAEHFLERGFNQFITYSYNTSGQNLLLEERAFGFEHILAQHAHQCKHLLWGDARGKRKDTIDNLYRWLGRELTKLPKPLAVFALSDERGEHVVRACELAGIDIPEQVAVLGVDNLEIISENLPVSLSSVDSNLYQLGYTAAQQLEDLMNGEKPPRQPIRVPPRKVITRTSTDILAIDNLNVARALRFIWDHYHETITVNDIVAITTISRRSLELAFKSYVGRTINEELIRVRLNHVKQLLQTTELTLYEIQALTGFGTRQHLHRVFTQSEKVSPAVYRRQHQTK